MLPLLVISAGLYLDRLLVCLQGGAVAVTLIVNKPANGAKEWISGETLHAGPLAVGATLTVTVPPGNASFVAFGAASTDVSEE